MDEHEESPILEREEELWDQLDHLEQRFIKSDNEEEELEPSRNTYKKPDKNKKLSKIKAYQEALQRHRQTNNKYYVPTDKIKLQTNIAETLKMMKEAKKDEEKMPFVLRNLGLKRLKILFRCGAFEQFELIIQYLETGELPCWVVDKYRELIRLRKQKN